MVQINFALKTVTVKIVYYGPGMSGKTTNLEVVHQRAPDSNRGDLTSIATDGDRTLFFDFMPLDLGTVAGMRTQFQIYTVPGQVYYNSTRKLVLQGVDGVIFIADSSASMLEENLESLRNLQDNLEEYGKSLDTVPIVIQYNKRDLPDAMSVEDLEAALNPMGAPSFEGIASSGQGVFPTLKALAAKVLDAVHSKQEGGAAPAAGASAPAVNAGTGFYPVASVPTAPAVAAPASPPVNNLSARPPVPDGSTGFYQAQASSVPSPQAGTSPLPGGQSPLFPPAGSPSPTTPLPQAAPMPPPGQQPQAAPMPPLGQQPQAAPMPPIAQQPLAAPMPPIAQQPPAAPMPPIAQQPLAAPMPPMASDPQAAPTPPAGWDMAQTQVHAPPTMQQPHAAPAPTAEQQGLRMAPAQLSQPGAAGPVPIRPSVPMGGGSGPAPMMQSPAGTPVPGVAPMPHQVPATGLPSRLKPRSTALPTPKDPARSRSAARTALFVTLALAAGVVLGSLVISVL